MYPAPFRYEAPHSLDEAVALLAGDGEAKLLAGGQSLVPMIKLRFAAPTVLVDLNTVPGLDYHRVAADGAIEVGALCRHADLESSDLLPERQPTMASAAPLIADPVVRNRGTLVGSLCHADPQGDWASVMLAMNGSVVAVGPDGRRVIPMAEFTVGPFQNALLPGEIAVEARIPAFQGEALGRYLKLERRVGDFATVGVAVAIDLVDGKVARAGIALTGVGPQNIKATDAEHVLVGGTLDTDSVNEAARLAAEAAQPRTDHRGSAAYKRNVVSTFVRRALRTRAKAVA